MTKVIISHSTGNEFSKAALKGFFNQHILQSYYTTIASFPETFLYTLGNYKFLSDIKRRSIDQNFRHYVHIHPFKELIRLIAIKTGNKKLIAHEKGLFSVDAIYRDLDKHVSTQLEAEKRKGATAIYAYEDGAYITFLKARQIGLRCIYDLPIGYWRSMHKILLYEKEKNPEWASTLTGLQDSKKKLTRKDEEISLSNLIIVASSFTANSLNTFPSSKIPTIKIIPYGFPDVTEKKYEHSLTNKLKLLFVGGLSQRKGLSYMFEAIESFKNHIELTVIGRMPMEECSILNKHLKKHIYIPSLSHKKILEQMQKHDVLVFPSLFEGFGLVITEAMAQGTPVITTERTAGPDIISHEQNGWLISAGSAEAIKNVIEKLLANPLLVKEAGAQASLTASKRPWHIYENELSKTVKLLI